MFTRNLSRKYQFPSLTTHAAQYAATDPSAALEGNASGRVVFPLGTSQAIGQATAVAFARAEAEESEIDYRNPMRATLSAVVGTLLLYGCALSGSSGSATTKTALRTIRRFGRQTKVLQGQRPKRRLQQHPGSA